MIRLPRRRLPHHRGQYSDGYFWTSPFAHENAASTLDPRLAPPSPHVSFDKRILWQSFSYDWLGNTSATDDDARGFYDRSLGTVTNGTATSGPYQLKSASNESLGGARTGALTAKYDDAGYLVSLATKRNGPCLPTGANCHQRFVYDWDEVGRLARARRWDLATHGAATDPVPSTTPAADLRYQYNAGDQRTLKTAVDASGNERHTVYVFSSLELRRTTFASGDYARGAYSEVPYLFAHGVRVARVAYVDSDAPNIPTLTNPRLHVFLELRDHLGSTSLVIDKDTSELVEAATYQPYGATESDYRPARWKSVSAARRGVLPVAAVRAHAAAHVGDIGSGGDDREVVGARARVASERPDGRAVCRGQGFRAVDAAVVGEPPWASRRWRAPAIGAADAEIARRRE